MLAESLRIGVLRAEASIWMQSCTESHSGEFAPDKTVKHWSYGVVAKMSLSISRLLATVLREGGPSAVQGNIRRPGGQGPLVPEFLRSRYASTACVAHCEFVSYLLGFGLRHDGAHGGSDSGAAFLCEGVDWVPFFKRKNLLN